MDNLLAQIILAARKHDTERWTNILFIVAVAAFYIIGSIIKAKATKREQEQEKPGRKPPETSPTTLKPLQKTLFRQMQRPIDFIPKSQPRPQAQPPRRKITRPERVGRKLPAKKVEQVIELLAFEPPEVPKLSPPKPQVQPKLEEFPEFTAETVKKLEAKPMGIPAEKPQLRYLSGILSDYDDPEKLRRAILHYEIIGKPLALRGPGEHIIGL
jgi:hypothetical protein